MIRQRNQNQKKPNISSFRRCRITKICRVLTYGEMKPIINLNDSGHVSNWKLISPLRQGLYHQNWQGGNYGDSKPPMESHDILTMQSFQVTWKILNAISPLPQDLWTPSMAGEGALPRKWNDYWSFKFCNAEPLWNWYCDR